VSTAPPWTAFANERLANEGYPRGGGRAAVVDLLDAQECALSAQEIEDQLKTGERTVGRATVYRVIDELVELGLLGRVELGDGIARFERVFPEGAHHHHHFVCSNCEKLVPFEDEELERVLRRVARREGLVMESHEVTLRGRCPDCS
jgi:Fur family ferric uptake transcriptional regulator